MMYNERTNLLHAFKILLPAKDTCEDLDPHGCAVNPDLCQIQILAALTCPRTCNACGKFKCVHFHLPGYLFSLIPIAE